MASAVLGFVSGPLKGVITRAISHALTRYFDNIELEGEFGWGYGVCGGAEQWLTPPSPPPVL